MAFSGLLTALLLCAAAAWAGPHWVSPYRPGCVCIPPGGRNFAGYYETQWRRWPDELRPHEDFTEAINREELPLPEPKEQLPLPMGEEMPELMPPDEGGIVPPDFYIEGTEPQTPAEPGTPGESILPGDLPGLPTEENQPSEPESSSEPEPAAEPPSAEQNSEQTELPTQTPERLVEKPAASPPKIEPPRANWSEALRSPSQDEVGQGLGGGRATHAARAAILYYRGATPHMVLPEEHPLRRRGVQPASHVEDAEPNDIGQPEEPPLALGGYCPVELVTAQRWTPGEALHRTVHHNRAYQFAGPRQRELFLADPERYVPGHGGHDPVLLVESQRRAAGTTKHAAVYQDRVYLFAGPDTLSRFQSSPQRYAASR